MAQDTFDDVDFDLFEFLSEHCLPRTPSNLDNAEWAMAQDFLMSSPPSSQLSKFPSFISPADMMTDSDSHAESFDPCEGWSVGNDTPFEERFPVQFFSTGIVQENRDSDSVLPEIQCPSDDTSMDGSSSASEWEPPRRLRERLIDSPFSPGKHTRSSAHVSPKANVLGPTSSTALVKQLFGDNMCTSCRDSPAKLICSHEPGKACSPCIRNRRSKKCSLISERRRGKQPVEVSSAESTPKPAAASSFRHAFSLQPSEGTIAGTRVALAELMDDMEVIQQYTAAVAGRLTRLHDSLSSSSF